MMIVGAGEAGAWAINVCKIQQRNTATRCVAVDDDPTQAEPDHPRRAGQEARWRISRTCARATASTASSLPSRP
ncbi:MAG: hypothetical protein ACLVJH_14690 [Faecalibacterium prausnitzii]